jgi:hypothetical protein
LFDGQPVGTSGEVINQTVNVGIHQLALRTDRGSQVTQTHDFVEGQSALYVYDASLPILRPMLDSDRSLIAERKMKEEVHRVQVEHNHGILRGNCRGELQISYYDVTYRPAAGSHGFNIPFRDLRLRTEGNTLHLLLAGTNREFAQFRTAEAETAGLVAQIWEKLKALER